MVKKDDVEEFEDDDDEEDDEEDEDEPVRKTRKGKSKDWIIQHSPETFTVINPTTKEVLAQAPTPELLSLQLLTIAAQKASESSKQTE